MDRWRRVEALFQAAAARPASERPAFLHSECGADDELRREVESLLAELSNEGVLATAGAPEAAGLGSTSPSLIGRRLGSYQVLHLIGAGGMGEVYRAHDTKLGRDVAIKTLPSAFTSDPNRVARFHREARVLASLNHPNIAQIHGLEGMDGRATDHVPFIVMELVDGEPLSKRIGRGPLPAAEALAIAAQIVEALDAAHERGIVHRDLKPANIVITKAGVVKVLDFGLARVVDPTDDAGDARAPTVTHDRTVEGLVVGTAAYMSPEQARGQPVDKRTDIWAFGCVLYEILTGCAAFARGTISETLAVILEGTIDWSAWPSSLPPNLRRLVERCLEKDPKRRLRDIGDAWAELQADTVKAVVRPTLPPAGSRFTVPILASALIAALTGVAWLSTRSVTVPRSVQFTFGAADETQLEPLTPVPSPDGTQIAFVARSESGERSLWIREIGSTVRPVDDTAGVQTAPFWSPDGRWVGFFAQGRLKKVSLDGGPALTIATISNLLGATWNRDNVIVLAPVNRTVLHKVSAFGGTPEPITTLNAERKENSHRWPSFLPDGRRFLFTARSDVIENNLIYVGSLGSTVVTPLVAAQSNASYAAGYLLFAREGTLLAQRFDVDRQVVSGESLSVVSPIAHNTPSSSAAFRISSDSTTLAYRPGALFRSSLTWFDRTGAKVGEVGEADNFTDVRLSPDGKVAAVVVPDPDSGNRDIWLVDLGTGTKTRFTTNPANDWQMTWAPDSRRLAFASDRNGPSSVYVKAIDGNEELLLRFPDRGVFPKDWPTDNLLTLGIDTPGGISSVAAVRLTGDRTPFAVGEGSRQRENDLMLTRDTTAMAFVSRESGLDEVYVAPFPKGGRRRVSVGGGSFPRWKAGGDELYYVSADGSIMRVPVRRGETIRPEVPIPLLRPCGGLTLRQQTPYDVTADGSRFLTICAPSTITPEIAVSVNWAPPLK